MSKKNSKKTVPELRFRGFTDPWEQRQLGEVGEIHNGRDYKHLQPGNIPVYGTSGYMLSVDDALSWNDDAVGIGRKGTIDKPCILRAPFWTVDTLFFVTPRSSTPLEFLFTLFESVNWKSKDESTGVPSLTKQAIVNTAVKVPDTSEQHQIGVFFSTLDNLIAAAERQEALLKQKKQAYLQLMFPQEGETQSRLRFAGFSGDWEKRQLGELAERTGSGGTPSSANPRYYGGSIPFLSIGDITGRFVDTTQKTLTEEGLTNSAAWVVPQGAISLAMYASYGKSAILSRPMATSQAFFNVVFTSDATRDFIYSRFQCAEVRHEWDAMVSTGTQPNLSGSKLKKWEISLPPLPEQRLIGQFFKTFDSLIAAAEERTRALKETKSAYLQRMFV